MYAYVTVVFEAFCHKKVCSTIVTDTDLVGIQVFSPKVRSKEHAQCVLIWSFPHICFRDLRSILKDFRTKVSSVLAQIRCNTDC